MTELSVVIGPETVRSYKRLAYETWWAVAEFIDNSTQSYFSNQEQLDKSLRTKRETFHVLLNYERDSNILRITDNAMGMSLAELERAVRIGNPPSDQSGRHEFGMGLKTAACWLGDRWTLRTSRLGEPYEYEVTFDVEEVASGNTNLKLREIPVDKSLHYTILTISQMHQKIGGRLLDSLKRNLRSIYRFDTRSKTVRICWGDEELSYDDRLELLKAADGTEYKKPFDFTVHGKRVHGWAGILEKGGRPRAGFAVARRGRLVVGQPDAWRPRSIFGQDAGTNDLINQRIVGEIHLDDFLISHTKNQILWQSDELELVEEELLKVFADYRHIAQNRRVRDQGGPTEQAKAVALDQIKEIVTDPDFVNLVTLNEVPAPELVEATLKPLRDAAQSGRPDATYVFGELTVKLFLDANKSSNDPYFIGDYTHENLVSVCINTQHPFWQDNIQDAQDMVIYLLNCMYDAIAEWKCMQQTGALKPDTVKVIKDRYMRQSFTRD